MVLHIWCLVWSSPTFLHTIPSFFYPRSFFFLFSLWVSVAWALLNSVIRPWSRPNHGQLHFHSELGAVYFLHVTAVLVVLQLFPFPGLPLPVRSSFMASSDYFLRAHMCDKQPVSDSARQAFSVPSMMRGHHFALTNFHSQWNWPSPCSFGHQWTIPRKVGPHWTSHSSAFFIRLRIIKCEAPFLLFQPSSPNHGVSDAFFEPFVRPSCRYGYLTNTKVKFILITTDLDVRDADARNVSPTWRPFIFFLWGWLRFPLRSLEKFPFLVFMLAMKSSAHLIICSFQGTHFFH